MGETPTEPGYDGDYEAGAVDDRLLPDPERPVTVPGREPGVVHGDVPPVDDDRYEVDPDLDEDVR